jgi:hypothetical protein
MTDQTRKEEQEAKLKECKELDEGEIQQVYLAEDPSFPALANLISFWD